MPNMLVLRPADAVEAAECWEIALEPPDRAVALMFARQPLEAVRTDGSGENLSSRGAYVLAEAEGGARGATILATGSEVALALKARDMLQAEGIPTAVVSMPCWELFELQDEAYRDMVIGRRHRPGRGGSGGAPRLGPLHRRGRRLRRHGRVRRLRLRAGPLRPLRHHAPKGCGRGQGADLNHPGFLPASALRRGFDEVDGPCIRARQVP